MQYAQMILNYIANKGISFYKLAQNTGISESTFSKWKGNPDSDVSLSIAKKIADYFNISIDDLLIGSDLHEWWQMPLTNGATTSGINPFEYYKIGNRVDIMGLVIPNAIHSVTFAILPVGFRPVKTVGFAAQIFSDSVFISRGCYIDISGKCVLAPTDRAGTENLPFYINCSFIAK